MATPFSLSAIEFTLSIVVAVFVLIAPSETIIFSSRTAMDVSIDVVSTTTCSLASIASNLVVISPYLTKPPPIATMAAIYAAIPASWSFILNFFIFFLVL